jgi:hypothetical protein
VDADEIGGSCPSCDAEFRPGIAECPDCGIPLVAAGEVPATREPAAPPPAALERSAPSFELGPEWSPRLVAFALACVATVALQLTGSLVAISSVRLDAGIVSGKERLRQFLGVVTPSMGVVLLVGALAVAGARLLGDPRRWARLSVFGAAAAVAGLSVVAAVTDLLWKDDGVKVANVSSKVLVHAAVLLLAVVAGWLSEAWLVLPAEERRPGATVVT